MKRITVLSLLVLTFILPFNVHTKEDENNEDLVRAAVIVTMLRFTSWENIAVHREELGICTYGEPLSSPRLQLAIEKSPGFGKILSLHPLQRDLANLADCHVVVFGPLAKDVLEIDSLKDLLSFCDNCRPEQRHVITLRTQDERIVFDIDLDNARSTRIKLSSDVLMLAKNLKQEVLDAQP